jgi:hypothetical protein
MVAVLAASTAAYADRLGIGTPASAEILGAWDIDDPRPDIR